MVESRIPVSPRELAKQAELILFHHGRPSTNQDGQIVGTRAAVTSRRQAGFGHTEFGYELRQVVWPGPDQGKVFLVLNLPTPGGGQTERVMYDFQKRSHQRDRSRRLFALGAMNIINEVAEHERKNSSKPTSPGR